MISDELKKVKDTNDVAAIKTAEEALSKTIQKIGEAMYKQEKPSEPNRKPEGDVKDTDFKETDGNNK